LEVGGSNPSRRTPPNSKKKPLKKRLFANSLLSTPDYLNTHHRTKSTITNTPEAIILPLFHFAGSGSDLSISA